MRGGRELLATMLGMFIIASGTYWVLGSLGSRSGTPRPPTASAPMFSLPGTIYLAQKGTLYSLNHGSISKLIGSTATVFSQPAVSPDGAQLVAALGDSRFTDLYLLSPRGVIGRRLTDDRGAEVNSNHWAFYPRFSADGKTVYYSWDPKVAGSLQDDLAVFSLDLSGGAPPGRQWTEPDPFTGGDTAPQPVAGGGLLYAGFSPGPGLQIFSRIWFEAAPGGPGRPLTESAANCGKPALSPAGNMIAMICSPTSDRTQLVIAPFSAGSIGAPILTMDDQLAASPAWAPDGSGVVYLAIGNAGPGFDLWWLPLSTPGAASPKPAASPGAAGEPFPGRRQITTGLDLDSTSAPAWAAT